jgi:hypothetical protein
VIWMLDPLCRLHLEASSRRRRSSAGGGISWSGTTGLRVRSGRQHSYYNSRRRCFCVVHPLGGFHEVRGLGFGDVDEGLRVTIGEREP